jgi:hypothetical protein
VWPESEKERGRKWAAPRERREEGFSPYFFPFSFSDFCFSFQNQFSNLFLNEV